MMNIFFVIILMLANLLLFLNHRKFAKIINTYDEPDSIRKIHQKSTPLIGGFYLILNLFFLFFFLIFSQQSILPEIFISNKSLFNFFFLSFSFFLIGYLDDKINISANKKFLFLFLLIYISVLIDKNLIITQLEFSFMKKIIFLENFSIFFTVLCVMLFVNAFNMFDGVNGQAAIYSIFIFVILFYSILNNQLILFFIIPLIFFVFYNLKEKMFLGNSGSNLISVIITQLLILSYNQNYFFADEILFLLLFPGLDMLRLFIERLLKKKNPFKADRNHLHHILLKKNNIYLTLTYTVGIQVLLYLLYLIYDYKIIYFVIFNIFYYISLLLILKKLHNAKK